MVRLMANKLAERKVVRWDYKKAGLKVPQSAFH